MAAQAELRYEVVRAGDGGFQILEDGRPYGVEPVPKRVLETLFDPSHLRTG